MIEPLAILGGFLYAAVEVFKMVRDNKAQWEHYAVFVLGLLVFSATRTNVFILAGIEDLGTDLFWNVSFLVGAIISVPIAGLAHDGLEVFKKLANG